MGAHTKDCQSSFAAPSGSAVSCATVDQCVVIKLGETERHLSRDEAERFAAAIYRACSDSCKAGYVQNEKGQR